MGGPKIPTSKPGDMSMQGRMPFAYDGTAILGGLEKLRRRSIRTGDCGGVESDKVVKRSKKPFLKALEFLSAGVGDSEPRRVPLRKPRCDIIQTCKVNLSLINNFTQNKIIFFINIYFQDCVAAERILSWYYRRTLMSTESPQMSSATRDILLKVRKMVPPMLEKFHKGNLANGSRWTSI